MACARLFILWSNKEISLRLSEPVSVSAKSLITDLSIKPNDVQKAFRKKDSYVVLES